MDGPRWWYMTVKRTIKDANISESELKNAVAYSKSEKGQFEGIVVLHLD